MMSYHGDISLCLSRKKATFTTHLIPVRGKKKQNKYNKM